MVTTDHTSGRMRMSRYGNMNLNCLNCAEESIRHYYKLKMFDGSDGEDQHNQNFVVYNCEL
jgi:hypothetical protein